MADRHLSNSPKPGSDAGRGGDSFSDAASSSAGVDHLRALDSDGKRDRTDVPERIELLLPGEAALVYQYLRDQLATVFDDAGHRLEDTA